MIRSCRIGTSPLCLPCIRILWIPRGSFMFGRLFIHGSRDRVQVVSITRRTLARSGRFGSLWGTRSRAMEQHKTPLYDFLASMLQGTFFLLARTTTDATNSLVFSAADRFLYSPDFWEQ